MCFSTPKLPQDTSAQQAQVANEQRQAEIQKAQDLTGQGKGSIDQAFAKFDDNYFDNYNKAYTDNYNPQVDDQFKLAQQQEGYNAARKGVQDSTPAIFAEDQLNKSYGQQRQQIASNALSATDNLRNNVQTQKSNLYALNSSAADPTLASERATAAAGTIPSTPQYSALGDLFSGLVNAGASYQAGANKQLPPGYAQQFSPGAGLPGSGSGRVIS